MGENGDVQSENQNTGRRTKVDLNWNQFGLSADNSDTYKAKTGDYDETHSSDLKEQGKELFEHEQEVGFFSIKYKF